MLRKFIVLTTSLVILIIVVVSCARAGELNNDQDNELIGQELVDSVQLQMPNQLMIRSVFSIEGYGDNITTTYYLGRFEKTEIETPEGKEYIIYNPNEKMTYQYADYTNEGLKFKDEIDYYGTEINSEIVVDLSFFIGETEELSLAERTTWKNYEVIYIETKDENLEGEQYTNKTWISTQYAYPLKGESYLNDELLYTMEIIEITDQPNINEDFFLPPEHINFEEFHFDFGIDNFQDNGIGVIDNESIAY